MCEVIIHPPLWLGQCASESRDEGSIPLQRPLFRWRQKVTPPVCKSRGRGARTLHVPSGQNYTVALHYISRIALVGM